MCVVVKAVLYYLSEDSRIELCSRRPNYYPVIYPERPQQTGVCIGFCRVPGLLGGAGTEEAKVNRLNK